MSVEELMPWNGGGPLKFVHVKICNLYCKMREIFPISYILELQHPWRRALLPILAFLLGEFHGQRSLDNYSPWVLKELDMTE